MDGSASARNENPLKLASYLIIRPNELCGARWEEIDIEKAEWVIPPGRMKMSREHVVPLPAQALDLIRELKGLTGNHEFLFPTYSRARAGESIRTETLVKALRQMGYTSLRSAYNRIHSRSWLDERRKMLQAYADFLDG